LTDPISPKPKFSQESFKLPLFDPPVPKDIHFFWYQQERSSTGVSESRCEFLKEINNADSTNVGFEIPDVLGFDAEYLRTFNEYAASYVLYCVFPCVVGRVQMMDFIAYNNRRDSIDNLETHLNELVKKELNGSMDARKVVEKYGTHFMTSTTFGGLKICAAT
jgi:hypothetical protein